MRHRYPDLSRGYSATVVNNLFRRFLLNNTALLLALTLAAATVAIYVFNSNSELVQNGHKNILVISAQRPLCQSTRQNIAELEKVTASFPWQTSLEFLELNAMRTSDPAIRKQILASELDKIQKKTYHAILAIGDTALQTLIDANNDIPPDIPVIFSWLSYDPSHLRRIRPNLTGVTQTFSLIGNINLGLRLWPDTRRIIVISGYHSFGRAKLNDLHKETGDSHLGIPILYLCAADFADNTAFLNSLADVARNAFIIQLPWRHCADPAGNPMSELTAKLSRRIRKPLLVMENPTPANDTLGGYTTSTGRHIARTATLLRQVLSDHGAAHLPFQKDTLSPTFDYRTMLEYHIPDRHLPDNSTFLRRPQSFFQENAKMLILLGGLVFFLVFSLLNAIIHFFRYRKLAANSMAIFSALPLRIGVMDRHEKIIFFQTDDTDSFNYGRKIKRLYDIKGVEISKIAHKFYEVFATGKTELFEYNHDGNARVMRIARLPYSLYRRDTLIWISLDNSELQNTRDKLSATLEDFELMFNNMDALAMFKDADNDFRIMAINRSASNVFGLPPEKIIGRSEYDLHRDRTEIATWLAKDKEAVADNCTHCCIQTFSDSSGAIRHGRVTRKLLTRKNGSRVLFVFTEDITELEKHKLALEDATTKFQLMLDNSPAFVLFQDIDDQFRLILCNRKCEEVIGIPVAEIIGKNDLELFSNREEGQKFLRDSQTAAEMSGPMETISSFTRADGSVRLGKIYRRAVTDKFGRRLLFVQVQDVTDMEESRKKIENANLLWDAVINALPFHFFAKDIDDDFKYVLFNDSFARFTGLSAEQLPGKTDAEIFPAASAAYFRKLDLNMLKSGQDAENVEKVSDADNNTKVIRSRRQCFNTVDGRRLILCAGIDITRETELLSNSALTGQILERIAVSADYHENLALIADLLQKQMGCDRIAMLRILPSGVSGGCDYDWHNSLLPIQKEMLSYSGLMQSPGLRLAILSRKLVLLTPDSNQEFTNLLAQYHAHAAAIAPVFVDGKLFGMLCLGYHSSSHKFTIQEQNLISSMANLISLAQIRQGQLAAEQRANYEKQMILNNIRIPIWLYDATGTLLRVNTAVSNITGRQEDELLRAGDLNIPADQYDLLPLREVTTTCKPLQKEVEYRGRDYVMYVEPVFNTAGEMINIVRSAVDITQLNNLMRNEQVLSMCMNSLLSCDDPNQAAEIIFAAICRHLHASRCYIMRYDYDEKLTVPMYECADGEKILQPLKFSGDESWLDVLKEKRFYAAPEITERHLCEIEIIRDLVKKHEIKSFYLYSLNLGGRLWGNVGVFYEHNSYVMSDDNLKFLQSMTHVIEVMLERKFNRDQLLAALRQSLDASKAKSFFLASMSHEIRTPLNAVIGFSELLQDASLARDVQKEYIAGINSAGNALLELINDVLDLSKLEAGQMEFTLVRTDPYELVKEVFDIFTARLREKNLVGHIDCRDLPDVFIDKLRIRQVLFNLIGNAVKFTSSGSITLKTSFAKLSPEQGELTIVVGDTGSGIDIEDQKNLFQDFVQSKTMRGTVAANQGTGLGLAICKRMLDRMDGKISLLSEPGIGSTFTVTLRHVRYAAHDSFAADAAPVRKNRSAQLAGQKILLVDDVLMNLKVLSAMLKKMGAETLCCSNGHEALRLLAENPADVVLTDLWMPDMDGAELAARIKAQHPHIILVALTADADSGNNFDMAIFDHVLTKPVNAAKLAVLSS